MIHRVLHPISGCSVATFIVGGDSVEDKLGKSRTQHIYAHIYTHSSITALTICKKIVAEVYLSPIYAHLDHTWTNLMIEYSIMKQRAEQLHYN